MQIKASKADLETALRVADIGLAGSGSDLATHFLFRVREGGVEILSFNQRICTAVPLKCQYEGEDGDAFTLEGKRISRWLGGVGDVAIEIQTVDIGEVRVSSPRSTIDIPSLDPAKFPFWDKTFSDAKSVASVASERLAGAFNYAKSFIYDTETNLPEISQVELVSGSLWATDKKAVTLITLDGLADAGFRVHGKDVASVTKFLGLKETADVEILEHDRTVFFRRAGGAVIGASRPIAKFPTLKVDKDGEDAIWWEIKTEELLRGIQCLSAAADWDSTQLKFSFDADSGKVVLAVTTVNGKENVYPIECIEQNNAEELPDSGFWLNYPYLSHIVGHFGGGTLKFGINQHKKGGYVRFRHASGDDEYLTVLVWRL